MLAMTRFVLLAVMCFLLGSALGRSLPEGEQARALKALLASVQPLRFAAKDCYLCLSSEELIELSLGLHLQVAPLELS